MAYQYTVDATSLVPRSIAHGGVLTTLDMSDLTAGSCSSIDTLGCSSETHPHGLTISSLERQVVATSLLKIQAW